MPKKMSPQSDGTYSSQKNSEYDYVLRYIAEAIDYRSKKVALTARAIEAYKGYPSRNGYVNAIDSYAHMWDKLDREKADAIRAKCKSVKPQKNMIVMRAIDSMVSQGMGGVGQFECAVYDPVFEKTPELVDKLDNVAMDFYRRNHIDSLLPTALEYAGLSGAVYSYLEYDTKKDVSEGKVTMSLIPDTEMLIDPLGAKRSRDRYIGHQDKNVSWADLKDKLKKSEYTDEYCLKSINEVDALLTEVEFWINKTNGNFEQIVPPAGSGFENLPQVIDTFYKGSAIAWRERNSKWKGTSNEDKFHASDVEVCYLTDLKNDIQFTVVNRKYIVEVKKHPYQSKIPYTYYIPDEFSEEPIEEEGTKNVRIDSPYVPLTYKKSMWEAYAYSPIIHLLDMFDDICALETMIYHTISIMTPITFTGNPKDIEKLGAIAGVSGEAIKGFIGNSVTIVNKAVDLGPAMSEVSRLEQNIMTILHGVDPERQSQMVGNRATAAEAMQAASLVSQGLNSLLANVETWAEILATKMIKMALIYEPEDFVYDLAINGMHDTLTKQDLAGDFDIHAVLKSRIKAEEHARAATTIQWFVPLMGSDAIPNKQAFAETVIPTLASGFTRRSIKNWFKKTEEQERMEEAQINALQAQQEKDIAMAQKAQGIQPQYIDPSSGGQFGAADIARALSSPDEDMEVQQTSRQLTRGRNMEPLPGEDAQPNDLMQGDGSHPIIVPFGEEDMASDEDAVDPTAAEAAAMLSPLQTAEQGGMSANDGITGANSPLTQGVMI